MVNTEVLCSNKWSGTKFTAEYIMYHYIRHNIPNYSKNLNISTENRRHRTSMSNFKFNMINE